MHRFVTPSCTTNWKEIGIQLEIEIKSLNIIEKDNFYKTTDCCNAMWQKWLEKDNVPTWDKVINTLITVSAASNLEATMPGVDNNTSILIIKESENMCQFYKNERYKISVDDCPPYQPDYFTSVTLIHHKEKRTTIREVISVTARTYKGYVNNDSYPQNANHSASTTNHEKSDDYFTECRSTKDITEIFKYISPQKSNAPNTILIEGAPGIGKTILSKEIAFQWANKNLLDNKLFLFLIFLRDPGIKQITTLKDFVTYAIRSNEQNKNIELIVQYLNNTSGSDVTIVFDGYDEISDELRHSSFIEKIINRKILKLCGLVITSRPTTSTILHNICDCRVEILGFTEEDRLKYIKQSLESNETEIALLQDYLLQNPFINSLCYIPLNMTILICLFKEISGDRNYILPKNQTEMNEIFICITISRFLKKKGISLTITSLKELPKCYKQQFKNLCELAFHLLGNDQIIFNSDDIQKYDNWSDLGLLKAIKYSNYRDGTLIASYNFLHFTLQEFLAAYYVASLPVIKEVSKLNDKFWSNRYLNSWVMYAGLTKCNSFAFKHFLSGRKSILPSLIAKPKSITNEIKSDKVKCLLLFQCFLEAGDDRICEKVGGCLMEDKIDLSNTTLLPKDIHTLSFFLIRSTTKQWQLLDLSKCCIGDNGCEILTNLLIGDDKHKAQITKVNLSCNQLSSGSISTILKLIYHFNAKELIITGNNVDSEIVFQKIFIDAIQQNSFHQLSIKTNMNSLSIYVINCKELLASQVKNYLDINCNIYSLFLCNTNFTMDDLLMLTDDNEQCVKLYVYKEDSDDHILYLQSEIQKAISKTAKEHKSWNFSYILISKKQILAYNVKHNQIIEVLKNSCKPSISAVNFTACELESSLYEIGFVLLFNFKLDLIDLSSCNIGDIQFGEFCKQLFSTHIVIKHLLIIKELNLSNNKLTDSCVKTIIKCLQYCVVEKLDISHNKINENIFCRTFKGYYKELNLLNFTCKVPLTVISSLYDEAGTIKFNNYVKSYITKFASVDASVVFDCLLKSANNNFLHHVIFLDCSSVLTINFSMITLLLKTKVNIEIHDNIISDLVAAELVERFNDDLDGKNLRYLLITKRNLYAYNYNFDEIRTFLPCDNSKVTLQLKNCDVQDVAIPHILKNVNFLKTVKLIDLSGCKIGDSSCVTFCNLMAENTGAHLYELNLSDNCLTSQIIVYITRVLQVFTVNKLVLSFNDIDIEEFNMLYFENKYQTYCNFSSGIPLILVYSKKTAILESQSLCHLCFMVYFLTMPSIEHFTNILSANTEYRGWIFLINTNIQMDYFDVIIKTLLANNLMKITIIEEHLVDDVAKYMMIKLKRLQVIKPCESVQYLLLSSSNCLANNINHTVAAKILNFRELSIYYFLFTLFFPRNTCTYMYLELIDLSNCNIGDFRCKILLDYFTSTDYTVSFLNLTNNSLSSQSVNTIAQLIIYSNLETLFVSLNDVKENHIADAVCRLQSKISEPVIRIFKSNHVALIISNLVIHCISQLIAVNSYGVHVTFLSLENCHLDNEHTKVTLDELNLSQIALQELELQCDVEYLDENKKTTHFILKNSNITDEAIILLGSKLLKKSLLTHLEISHCKLKENELFNVISASEEASLLEVLNLKSIYITNHIAGIITGIISRNLQLKVFNLSQCSLQEYDGMIGILKAAAKLSALQFINLSFLKYYYTSSQKSIKKPSSPSPFNVLPSIISSNQSLEYLNISNCKIKNDDFANIMKSITLLESIKHLDISGNTVTDMVADNIALAIRRSRDLEHLNMSNSCISEDGLLAIFNDNFNLQHLDVSFCKLTEEAIKILANCLKVPLPNLKHFDISGNYMNQSSARRIAEALSLNKSLHYLDLSECGFVDFSIIDISLYRYSRLKTLILRSNCVFQCRTLVAVTDPAEGSSYHLEHLDISKCDLYGSQIIKITKQLQLLQVSTLKCLDISHNILSDNVAITTVITCNPLLEKISMSNCELSGSQINEITKTLKSLSRLQYFNISHNNATTDEAVIELDSTNPLKQLYISNCGLSEFCVTTVISTISLLDVSENKLTTSSVNEIISVIISNPLLQHLNVANCELSELQIITLCRALQRTSLLTFLDISHNEVTRAAANKLAKVLMNNKLLQHLNFSACHFQEDTLMLIIDSLAYITSLVSFDVSYNIITEKSAKQIADVLSKSIYLEQLSLCACFADNSIAAMEIFKAISHHSSLIHLNLKLNVFNSDLIELIASVLEHNLNIKYLDLGRCNLQNSGFMKILNSLAKSNAFQYLNLEENVVSESLASKVTSLVHRNSTLKHLNLCNCNLPKALVKKIIHAVCELHSVEYLNVSGNEAIGLASEDLMEALSRNNKVRHLDFSRCRILEKGTLDILMSLTTIKCLRSLNFHSCYFDESSTSQHLPLVIMRNMSLQYLNLTDCNLKVKGLVAIAKALQENIPLKHLCLSSNYITNEVSQQLALAVSKKNKLQCLALSDCQLEETGLISIAEALCKISSLRHLDLSHNTITDKAASTIASAIAYNTKLECLDFSFCVWQETGVTVIHEVINKLALIKEADFRLH